MAKTHPFGHILILWCKNYIRIYKIKRNKSQFQNTKKITYDDFYNDSDIIERKDNRRKVQPHEDVFIVLSDVL